MWPSEIAVTRRTGYVEPTIVTRRQRKLEPKKIASPAKPNQNHLWGGSSADHRRWMDGYMDGWAPQQYYYCSLFPRGVAEETPSPTTKNNTFNTTHLGYLRTRTHAPTTSDE